MELGWCEKEGKVNLMKKSSSDESNCRTNQITHEGLQAPFLLISPQHPGEPVTFGITVEQMRPRSRNVKADAVGRVETIGSALT